MALLSVRGTIVAFSVFVGLLSLIVVLSISFARVTDDEICQLFYPDGSRLITQTEPGLVFVGPGYEKHCVPRHTLHLTFTSDSTTGLTRKINSRTSEGLPVTLEVDVEYRFTPAGLESSMLRTGFSSYQERLLMATRAEVRNVASFYEAESFLRGSRETIATDMRDRIARTLVEKDGVLIEVVRVNLLTIDVDDRFENRFQQVEDIRLLQLQAQADLELAVIEELRLNETELIAGLADRERRIQQARAEVTAAELAQQANMTTAQTEALRDIIQAESARIQERIKKETALQEAEADQNLKVRQAERQAIADAELAETARLNMVTEMNGKVRKAADRARDIATAELERTRRLESLASVAIDRTLTMFNRTLAANVTAQQIRDQGVVDADVREVNVRGQTEEHLAIQRALNMTDEQLAALIWYRALGHSNSTSRTVFMDYTKVAFMREFGDAASGVQPTVNVES
eukprot:TRINITY_DN10464_c0_g1_i1.p2 TRINITY_DN10464_c0_g1~~TRINITY_DN10464_c0_g1_i1.p2  ORF type:complete len:462 (+),score=109.49 TRINITY_DN10464_c0_g1_i1:137-1522(+)